MIQQNHLLGRRRYKGEAFIPTGKDVQTVVYLKEDKSRDNTYIKKLADN